MSFFEILGHKRQIDILQRAYGRNKLAHSYIFSGPMGVGKKLVAKEFTKALNCENTINSISSPAGGHEDERSSLRPAGEHTKDSIANPAGEPRINSCGECSNCQSIEEGTHLNFISVAPEKGIIKIEQVRDILKSLSYKVDKGTRVVIIDDAHTLNTSAQNALLKTLEEPPPNTVLILVTSRTQDFLTTILSRCQRISFGPLEESVVKDYLAQEEGLTEDKAMSIARLSDGSLTSAFLILDEGLDKKCEDYLAKFLDLMGCGSSEVEVVIKESGLLSKDESLDEFLNVLKTWYRDIALLNVDGGEFLHNKDFLTELERDKVFGFSKSARAFAMVEEALFSITPPRYGNKQLTLEVLLMSLSGAMASTRQAALK